MQAASQHVYDVNAQIQSQLNSLLARLDPLVGSWQGSAATSFQTLKERWHQDAPQLNAALRAMVSVRASAKAMDPKAIKCGVRSGVRARFHAR